MDTLQGQGDLGGEGLQQPPLLRLEDGVRVGGTDRQHPAGAHGCPQGQIEDRVGRQGVGPQPGGLLVVIDPLGQAQVGLGQQAVAAALDHRLLDPVAAVRQQDQHPGLEDPGQARAAVLDDLTGGEGRRQGLAGIEQGLGAAFPVAGDEGLVAQAGGEVADDQGHHQHQGKGEQVLGVGHREGEARRHEEQVEGGHVEQREPASPARARSGWSPAPPPAGTA